MEIETSNLVAIASPWMGNHPWKGCCLVTWTIYTLVVTNHISGTADRLWCCQLRWTVSVVNWWWSSVTSLSHWPSTSVYNTVGVRHRVARVCQRQRRLIMASCLRSCQLSFFRQVCDLTSYLCANTQVANGVISSISPILVPAVLALPPCCRATKCKYFAALTVISQRWR